MHIDHPFIAGTCKDPAAHPISDSRQVLLTTVAQFKNRLARFGAFDTLACFDLYTLIAINDTHCHKHNYMTTLYFVEGPFVKGHTGALT